MQGVKHIAVIGGGPAGALAAAGLASGFRVTLFDEKLAWEKPCGGGVTHKALLRYPFLADAARPKKVIRRAVLHAHNRAALSVTLPEPLLIFSRYDLNALLLDRAAAAGAAVVQDHISGLERTGNGWELRGRDGKHAADFVVMAAGARTPFRDLTGPLDARNVGVTLGYYVPGSQDSLEVQFLKAFEGYIWIFPRTDHLSIGIYGRPACEASSSIKERLHRYMDERGMSRSGARFFSHLLPSLDAPAFRRQQVLGEGWAAVGDAAGMVDPVTGEGIYYALRSGELLAECALAGRLEQYAQRVRDECLRELEFAALLNRRFYFETFLGGDVPTRMIQFARRSATFRRIVTDLFAGSQGYLDLKKRLLDSLPSAALEYALDCLAHPFRRAPAWEGSKSEAA